MDDRLGPGFEYGLADGAGVEQIERDRLRPERPDPLSVGGRPEGADHLVTSIDELRNDPGADRTARPSDEDSHRVLLFGIGVNVVTSAGFRGSLLMTPGARRM